MKIKKLLVIGVLAATIVTSLGVARAQQASTTFGRSVQETYYTGTGSTRDWLFMDSPDIPYKGISADWDTTAMNVTIFKAEMRKRLYSSTDYNSSRAAAIINMMLGIPGDSPKYNVPSPDRWRNGVSVAKSNFAEWEKRVDYYNDNNLVDFNFIYTESDPQDWLGSVDVVDKKRINRPDIILKDMKADYNDKAIQFRNPNGTVFTIIKKCANLTGPLGALEQPPVTPPTPPTSPTPPAPTARPFFEVNGGDVVAGASIATNTTVPCSAGSAPRIAKAGIAGWNNRGAIPEYAGAGGSHGAMALGFIQDYVTRQGSGRSPTESESTQLSFANKSYAANGVQSLDTANGMFGGQFGTSPCIDYWSKRRGTPTAMPTGSSVSDWGSGVYSVTGNQTIMTGALGLNKHITLYVDGNVTLVGPGINFATNATTRSQIPSFKLIVHGVVYIDPSVTQLDGVYAAIPDDNYATAPDATFGAPPKGTIVTCSTGVSSGIYAACNKQLIFNGSVAAYQVWLLRTYGSVDVTGITAPRAPAEVFNYVPDVWLSRDSAGGALGGQGYQSIIGLPPIL